MIPTTVIGSQPVRLQGPKYAPAYFGEPAADAAKDAVRQAVEAQLKAGIDIVSDGQTAGDFVKTAARRFRGVVIQERPVVLGEVEYVRGPDLDSLRQVRGMLPAGVGLKGIITGPYTLAKSSENRHYKSIEDLAFAFAEGLAKEAAELDGIVDWVQVDEPFYSVDYPEYGKKLTEMVFASVDSPRMLHVCGDVSAIFDKLVEYRVDCLEHEFAANPGLWGAVKDVDFRQTLGVGVVRSDVNKAETAKVIEARMRAAFQHVDASKLMFNPDCGMRNLDVEVASQKLANMVAARNLLGV